jgi:glycosyltransferase involved in cell wall biosynthesis
MPRVSVIVPVFNGAAYLEAALQSALSQTFADLEVIVVDDGSSDSSAAVVERVSDSRLRLIRRPHRGLAAARNTGIRAASGDAIAFLDADDVWLPRKIEAQISRLDADPRCGLVYGWHIKVDASLRRIGVFRLREEGDLSRQLAIGNVIGPPSNVLVRLSDLEAAGSYDESTELRSGCEDWDLNQRIAERARVACVRRYLLLYRVHPGSMNVNTQLRSLEYVVEKLLARRPDLEPLRSRILANAHWEIALKHHAQGRMNLAREAMRRSFSSRGAAFDPIRRVLYATTFLPLLTGAYHDLKRSVNRWFGIPASLAYPAPVVET